MKSNISRLLLIFIVIALLTTGCSEFIQDYKTDVINEIKTLKGEEKEEKEPESEIDYITEEDSSVEVLKTEIKNKCDSINYFINFSKELPIYSLLLIKNNKVLFHIGYIPGENKSIFRTTKSLKNNILIYDNNTNEILLDTLNNKFVLKSASKVGEDFIKLDKYLQYFDEDPDTKDLYDFLKSHIPVELPDKEIMFADYFGANNTASYTFGNKEKEGDDFYYFYITKLETPKYLFYNECTGD